jgi:hypothetical protein
LRTADGRHRIIKRTRQRDIQRNLPDGRRHCAAVDNFVCNMVQATFKLAVRLDTASTESPSALKKLFLIMTLERID